MVYTRGLFVHIMECINRTLKVFSVPVESVDSAKSTKLSGADLSFQLSMS